MSFTSMPTCTIQGIVSREPLVFDYTISNVKDIMPNTPIRYTVQYGGLKLDGDLFQNKLNGGPWKLEGIAKLEEAFKANSLRSIRFWSCVLSNREIKELSSNLTVNSSITQLFFGYCSIDITDIAEYLKVNKSLKDLSFCWQHMGNLFRDTGGKALANALKVNDTLISLNLEGCSLDEISEMAEALKVSSLTSLNLTGNQIGNRGSKALAASLKENHSLTILNMASCGIEDVTGLAEALALNRSLKRIVLSSNQFGNFSGKAFAVALRVNSSITELDLSNCNLTDVLDFADALRTNSSLKLFSLNYNKIGDASGKALAMALKVNNTLTTLYLSSCGLKDVTELAEALKINRTVTDIDMSFNAIEDAGGRVLAAALKVNDSIVIFDVSTYPIQEAIKKEVEDKIRFNRELKGKKQREQKENGGEAAQSGILVTSSKIESIAKTVNSSPSGLQQTLTKSPIATTITPLQHANSVSLSSQGQEIVFPVLMEKETAQKLKDLPNKYEALANRVQKLIMIDHATIEALQGRASQLIEIFKDAAKKESNNREKAYIEANPQLQVYYEFFARLFRGTWMACQTINSKMVENAESNHADYIGEGLDQIGKRLPGFGLITGFFSGAIKGWNYRDKRKAVQYMANLFSDENAFSELSQIARQITLAQEKEIHSMKVPQGVMGKIKEGIDDLGAMIQASDANTPLKRKAEEDCNKLLKAIKEGQMPLNPSPVDFLSAIMGAGYVYQPPATNLSQPQPVAISNQTMTFQASPQLESVDANMQEIVKELLKMRMRDAEKEADIKQLKEKMARLEAQQSLDEVGEFVGDQAQLLLSRSKQAIQASSPSSVNSNAALADASNTHAAEIAAIKAKQSEHADGIDRNNSELKIIKKKITNDSTCTIA